MALTYGCACLAVQSVRALGKQWTYKARVIEGHELVTQARIRWCGIPSIWECLGPFSVRVWYLRDGGRCCQRLCCSWSAITFALVRRSNCSRDGRREIR